MSPETPESAEPTPSTMVNQIEVLDRPSCVELIESTPIGRIGFWADDAPLVLPVNFEWFEDTIVFRTLEGQKLTAAAAAQTVCFEVDHWDAADQTGWSVVVTGQAREVTEWAECEELERIGLVPWERGQWRPLWVRIEPTAINGRILRRPATPPHSEPRERPPAGPPAPDRPNN